MVILVVTLYYFFALRYSPGRCPRTSLNGPPSTGSTSTSPMPWMNCLTAATRAMTWSNLSFGLSKESCGGSLSITSKVQDRAAWMSNLRIQSLSMAMICICLKSNLLWSSLQQQYVATEKSREYCIVTSSLPHAKR